MMISRLLTLAFFGICATFVGLSTAGYAGHRVALALGVPPGWYEVDFNHPSAMLLAVFMQFLLISLGFFLIGQFSVRLSINSIREFWAAANPLVTLLGFLCYRAIQPGSPEHAYLGPASLLMSLLSFPLLFLVCFLGRKYGPQ
jgi:hypothetical protein